VPRPPFSTDRWYKRASRARSKRNDDHRVWYNPDDDFEYEKDPNPAKGTWHRIRYRRDEYQEIDHETGMPVAGGEGEFHRLR
jgi:hypothetical protein